MKTMTEYQRECRARRLARGLCVRCGQVRVQAFKSCFKCRQLHAGYAKAYRDRSKATRAEKAKAWREANRDRHRATQRRWASDMREHKRLAGLCYRCGRQPALTPRGKCAECCARSGAEAKARYAKLKMQRRAA